MAQESKTESAKLNPKTKSMTGKPPSAIRVSDFFRPSDFGILPARHFSDAGLVGEKIGVIILFYLETRLI
jgi:hypothetical protein